MTGIEVSLCDQNYIHSFPERSINVENDKKECEGSSSLKTREERASLLKAGFTGRDIESEYIKRNGIVVIDIDWQDLNSKLPS